MEKQTDNSPLNRYTAGFGVAFLIAALFNGLLIVAKESYAPLKDWMKSLFGHHWTTHGIFVIVLFVLLGYILSNTGLVRKVDADKTSSLVITGTVLGGLLVVGFFFRHLFE
jgi:hypothetical protein